MDDKKLRTARYLIAAGELLQGYDTAIVAVAILFLKPQFNLSTTQSGLLLTATDLGGIIGLLISGYLADKYGRRAVFSIDLIIFTLFALLSGFSQNFLEIYITRFILGMAIGADIPVITSFLGEIAPSNRRGRFIAFTPQFFQIMGTVAASALGLIFKDAGVDVWRWLFIAGAIPSAIIFLARRSLPESPVWLAKNGRIEEAEIAAKKIGVTINLQEISPVQTRFKELLTAKFLVPLAIVYVWGILHCVLSPFSQKATPYILKYGVGSSTTASFVLTMIIQVGAIIGMYAGSIAIDKTNRKVTGTIGLFLTGAFYILTAFVGIPSHSMIIMGAFYFILNLFYWTFIPTLSYVWGTEIFPSRIRGTANGIQFTSCRVGGVIGGNLVTLGIADIGVEKTIAFGMLPVLLMILILWIAPNLNKNQGQKLESIEQTM
ncbi:MFS transporter [Paenibacillus filicis]|uniref:MFS transporter n=1 Tax=Paenibacillus gyeongsangnamensis TaxID=3388067 RepID=A0ABT4Q905_9BACL|nr:MFS transporter [Paenibacillus filicis]MCZ8513276.1 MFS transporter [Paenibacillus filicis]